MEDLHSLVLEKKYKKEARRLNQMAVACFAVRLYRDSLVAIRTAEAAKRRAHT